MKKDPLDALRPGLLKSALAGHKEVCPLCGQEVLSVALHFASCPVANEEGES